MGSKNFIPNNSATIAFIDGRKPWEVPRTPNKRSHGKLHLRDIKEGESSASQVQVAGTEDSLLSEEAGISRFHCASSKTADPVSLKENKGKNHRYHRYKGTGCHQVPNLF